MSTNHYQENGFTPCKVCDGRGYPLPLPPKGEPDVDCDVCSGRGYHLNRRRYVNAYAITREYGGPEEGGWWYDVAWPLGSIKAGSKRRRKKALAKLRAAHGDKASGDISSVLGGCEVWIGAEDGPAMQPGPRPHYE